MHFRQALVSDIRSIQYVRNAVKENTLSSPSLVTDEACADYITRRGKGWVCIIDEKIVGFSIIDFIDPSIWALFVLPAEESKGIGKALMNLMLQEYFSIYTKALWLTTSEQTRAETFYRLNGWKEIGKKGDEIKFEMSRDNWLMQQQNKANNASPINTKP